MSKAGQANWTSAIIVIGAVSVVLAIQGGFWFFYLGPALGQGERISKAEANLRSTTEQLNLLRRQLDETARQRDAHLRTITDLNARWDLARNQFVAEIDRDIKEALSGDLPGEGQPKLNIAEMAQKLLADRDAVRRQLVEIEDDVQHVYDRLDGDIDTIRSGLEKPIPNNEELRELIRRLASHWDEKVRDVNQSAENLLSLLSCPHMVAAKP